MDIDDIVSSGLTTMVNSRNAIKSALTTLGVTVPSKCTFRNYANLIYNIGASTSTNIVSDTTIDTTGLDSVHSILKQLVYANASKVWIRTAIRARGVDTNGKSLSDYSTLISGIKSTSSTLPMLSITSTAGTDYYTTKITVSTALTSGNSYKYAFTEVIPMLGDDISSWAVWDGTSELSCTSSNEFLCIAEVGADNLVDKVGLVQAVRKEYTDAGTLTITSAAGSKYYSTALTVSPTLTSGNKYYYKIYDSTTDTFKTDDVITVSKYTVWDGSSDIVFTNNTNKILLVECNSSNAVQYAGTFTPVTKAKPEWFVNFTVTSLPGSTAGYTKVTTSTDLISGDKYYYRFGVTYDTSGIDLENFDATEYTAWNGTADIEAGSETTIFVVDVDGTNTKKVMQAGSTTVNIKAFTLENLAISSVAGTIFNQTILTVSPTLTTGNHYVYSATDSYSYPTYGDTMSGTTWDGTSNLIITNGTRILLTEVNSSGKALKAGFITVASLEPYAEVLLVSTSEGSAAGTTKLAISPTLTSGNRYYYTKGTTPVYYGKTVSGWTYWDGISDISGFLDDDIITVAEATSNLSLIKAGMATVINKAEALETLIFYSLPGSTAGYTHLATTSSIPTGRTYKYAFNNTATILLNYNASSWTTWDGTSDIKATAGDTITLVEVNSSNLVKMVGTATIRVKDPDPELGTLTVTSVAGTTTGYTKITVSPTLTEGFRYLYSLTSDKPKYGDNLNTWSIWDGTSELKIVNGSAICVAEATTDMYARSAGTTTVVSKP